MTKRTPYFAALILAWRLCLLAGVGGAVLLAPAARAQDLPEPGDGFTWERVGDVAIDVFGLAFGSDSTLWATADRGIYRLDTTEGFPGEWVHVLDSGIFDDAILALGRGPDGDTLVATTAGSTRRSVDGGLTWEQVHNQGGGGLYEVPAGYPYAGRILTGATSAIAYSDDRAASFTASVVPTDDDDNRGGADDFVALPPGSAHPGRILAAGRWGVNVSDDGGQTFRASGLWQVLYYVGERIGVVERPGGGVGAVMGGFINGQPTVRAWSSEDEGETWGPGGGQPLPEGPPSDAIGGAEALLSLGGASALVVLHRGTVYRTDDAEAMWTPEGRAPEVSPSVRVASAALDPEGRLYVGLHAQGGERGWVWRTKERLTVPVGVEPTPEPEEGLGLETTYYLTDLFSGDALSGTGAELSAFDVAVPAYTTRLLVVADSIVTVPTAGEPSAPSAPPAFALEPSYPNPFTGTTTLAYTLARGGPVRLRVFDVLGREVARLVDGDVAAGRHLVPFDGRALASGIYVCRLEREDAVVTRRMVLVR